MPPTKATKPTAMDAPIVAQSFNLVNDVALLASACSAIFRPSKAYLPQRIRFSGEIINIGSPAAEINSDSTVMELRSARPKIMTKAPTVQAKGLVVISAKIKRNFSHSTCRAISRSSESGFLAVDLDGQKAAHTKAITTSQGEIGRYIICAITFNDLRACSVTLESDDHCIASRPT